ncbi:hypothetical protein DJ533_11900 [Acinetobacter defluvii]|uniref:Uncharacterized protein n=1 Tax=Acinetobacter defluvii TaxID=1871111 RepID=A0A2S2FE51_9GAMM|nr:hypothetical protein [Acinetobacter defluvii]AWL29219.1 hypothetical protein DJ533_11900 [Acinetobacter defluvii]
MTKHDTNNALQTYDAGELVDAHTLAKSHLSWVNALVSTVIQNNKTGKTFFNQELLDVAQYLSDTFADEHDLQREAYQKEVDSNKKAVTL